MERLLEVCKAAYPNFYIEIYEEPWSSWEFFSFYIEFNGIKKYVGRVHKYQLIDIIHEDLKNENDKALLKELRIY